LPAARSTGADPARGSTDDVDEFAALSRDQLLDLVRQLAQRRAERSRPSEGAGNAPNKAKKQK
jgi:hypothetical protein